jgi:glycyl-tRNA synthetase beta chain
MSRRDFLVEIGTEELPPRALRALSEALGDGIARGLDAAHLKHGRLQRYATPRRLAVLVKGVAETQPEQEIRRRGPPVKVAFDAAGQPTRAAEAFAQSCETSLESLRRVVEDKGEFLFYEGRKPGRPAPALLPGIVQATLDALPIPRRMRWGSGEAAFVRPVHWIVMLWGREVLPARIFDIDSGNNTRGHRFHAPRPLRIASPASYANTLRKRGYVLTDLDERLEKIRADVTALAQQNGGEPVGGEALWEEVAALVEWPVPLLGSFDPRFLELPREVLTATLQDHQRYFPLQDNNGRLLPHFIAVANLESRDPGKVRAGNERVVQPRLADARFFYETDRRTPLADRVPRLATVVYHNKLGNRLERVERVRALARSLARMSDTDVQLAERAALLAKADLATLMVGEFPELQGVMGRYYALADGEDARVAQAIEEHYRPRFAGDALPADDVSVTVALADKLETLAGLFGIGQQPTGEKDPFALRRHALGVARILVEKDLRLSLDELVKAAFAAFPDGMVNDARTALEDFIYERLRGYLREAGHEARAIEAVLCMRPATLARVPHQLDAVRAFIELPEAGSLAAANKRVANILRKAEASGEAFGSNDATALKEPAELQLHAALTQAARQARPLYEGGDYTGYLKTFAVLKAPVDAFFDSVMVMTDDASLRRERLALLRDLRTEMNRIADLSQLSS